MIRTTNCLVPLILTLALLSFGAGAAKGQGYYSSGSWGSSGSSGGSSGSYGSYGSWGSSGGSFGSSGSYGSYGSSGAMYASFGSSGSSGSWGGSSGCWGCSGGSDGIYVHPRHHHLPATPLTRRTDFTDDEVASDPSFRRTNYAPRETLSDEPEKTPALLELRVPEDSLVYLGGQQMTLTGHKRIYFSQPLAFGKTYSYSIEVETMRDGRTLKGSTLQRLKAGDVVQIEASFEDGNHKLTLRQVPDASSAIALQTHPSNDKPEAKVAGKPH